MLYTVYTHRISHDGHERPDEENLELCEATRVEGVTVLVKGHVLQIYKILHQLNERHLDVIVITHMNCTPMYNVECIKALYRVSCG